MFVMSLAKDNSCICRGWLFLYVCNVVHGRQTVVIFAVTGHLNGSF